MHCPRLQVVKRDSRSATCNLPEECTAEDSLISRGSRYEIGSVSTHRTFSCTCLLFPFHSEASLGYTIADTAFADQDHPTFGCLIATVEATIKLIVLSLRSPLHNNP